MLKKLIIVKIFLFITTLLIGLSGTYTIGGNSPNFSTINEAVDTLETDGITDDVTFLIRSGTYQEQVEINYIEGSSPTQKIIFKADPANSGDVYWKYHPSGSTTNYVVKLKNTSYLTFQNIHFEAINYAYRRVFVIGANVHNIQIIDNSFYDQDSNSSTKFIYSNAGGLNSVDIVNNEFTNGGYAIYLSPSSSLDEIYGLGISNNTFTDNYTSISLSKINNLNIIDNQIEHAYKAVEIENLEGEIIISRNLLSNIKQYGMLLSYLDAGFNIGEISNNIIWITGENYSGSAYNAESKGLSFYSCDNIELCYNSVLLTGTSTYYETCSFYAENGENSNIKNNAFINLGGGMVVNTGNLDDMTCDYNNFFGTGLKFARVLNDYYYGLEDFGEATSSNQNSISIHPFYDSEQNQLTASAWIDNSGTPVGSVTSDFAGNSRDTSHPDIGAWEFSSDPADTPLNGSYDIGTSKNFATISAAVDALNKRGVSGTVNFFLYDSSYYEQFTIYDFPGASSSKKVFFTNNIPEKPVLNYEATSQADNYIAKLIGTDYVTFYDIEFEPTNSTYGRAIQLQGKIDNLTIQQCSFMGNGTSSSSDKNLLNTDYSHTHFSSLSIFECDFQAGGAALSLKTNSDTLSIDIGIEANEFNNNYRAIELSQMKSPFISGNNLTDFTNIGLQASGIFDKYQIKKNKIFSSEHNPTGIALYSSSGGETQPQRGLVANNLIKIAANSSGTGITFGASNTDLVYNSIWVNKGKAFYSYNLGASNLVKNNIFQCNDGYSIDIATGNETTTFDYNDYFTQGIDFVKWDGTLYFSLFELQTETGTNANSFNLKPFFTNEMLTTAPFLNDLGDALSFISTDYFGDSRSDSPDPGADEFTSGANSSPLAGTYTIGNETRTDYSSILEAVSDLTFRGVNGPTIFQILTGSYTESIEITKIPGADSNNVVTFTSELGNAADVVWTLSSESSESQLVLLTAAEYLNFDKITFSTEKNYTTIFELNGICRNIEITDSEFFIPESLSGADHFICDQQVLENMLLENNHFDHGDYGFYLSTDAVASVNSSGVVIKDNHFENISVTIYVNKCQGLEIDGNSIIGSYNAIDLNSLTQNFALKNNFIINEGFDSYQTRSIVKLNYCDFESENYGMIYNNLLESRNNSAQTINGFSINYSTYSKLYYNTIYIEQTNSICNSSALNMEQCDNMIARNNIFSMAEGQNLSLDMNNNTNVSMDHNDFYAEGYYLAEVDGMKIRNLIELSAMTDFGDYSIIANPLISEYHLATCKYLDRKGVSVPEVTTDINGNSRAANPDIGANSLLYSTAITQLSGTYYIGNLISDDYENLSEAFSDVLHKGMGSDVELIVRQGIYQEQIELFEIPNSGNKHDLLVRSDLEDPLNVELKFEATQADANYLVKLNGIDNLHWKELTFENIESDYNKLVEITGKSDNNRFENCIFKGTEIHQDSNQNNALITSDNSTYSSLTFDNNTFEDGGYTFYSTKDSELQPYADSLKFIRNIFEENYEGIRLKYESDILIYRNTFSQIGHYCLYLEYCDNYIDITHNSFSGLSNHLVVLNNCGEGAEAYTKINNNFFNSPQTGVTYQLLSLNNSNAIELYHNSFNLKSDAMSASRCLSVYDDCNYVKVINNIFANFGDGYSFEIESAASLEVMKNNLFYSSVTNFGKWNGTDYSDLGILLTDSGMNQDSYLSNPQFLSPGSPAIEEISTAVNNGFEVGITDDFMQNPRDFLPDIGCYEVQDVTLLDAPQNFSLEMDVNGNLSFSWEEVENADFYQLLWAETPDGEFEPFATVSETVAQFLLPAGVGKRFYRVKAIKYTAKNVSK